MPTIPTTTTSVDVIDVVDAMRSIVSESDRWHLAESLLATIPSGSSSGAISFDSIVDAAAAEGVSGNLKPNTLRLYRDTAARWPADRRVPNVSFSAHRESMNHSGGIDARVKLLELLAQTLGGGNVTVAAVRRAVAMANGKAPATAKVKSSAVSSSLDVIADLKSGGKTLISAIEPSTTSADLDSLHAGLTKVIAHVERLRAKAARKAGAASKAAPKSSTTMPTAVPKSARARKAAGDLRGL